MGRKLLLLLLFLSPLPFYFLLRGSGIPAPPPDGRTQSPLTKDEHFAIGCLAIAPAQTFPGAMPWLPLFEIGQQETKALEELAGQDPIAFLEKCLERYESEVQGYRCYFDKQERVKGKLLDKEVVLLNFREKPFSVHMDWKKPALHIPSKTLFVDGENDDNLVVRVFILKHFKPDSDLAMAQSRFPITQSGMGQGMRNTLRGMYQAREAGTLYVTYEGKVKVKEVGDRWCYKFIRAPHVPPVDDGVNELIIYIDAATQLQVGSVLLDTEGKLIAEYYFRDIELNPKFDAKQFTTKAL